jgi:mono/diheme cytochrome c family protein
MLHSRTILSLAAVIALAACGGDKSADTAASTPAATPPAAEAPAPAETPATVASVDGAAIYSRCMACHQANGEGVAGAFPPLAGSEWVTGPASRPIAVVLHGLQGEITVKGAKYNNMMMAYGTGAPMTDDEVAAVVTHIRSNWGNAASPVTAADVKAVREATAGRTGAFTEAELKALQ